MKFLFFDLLTLVFGYQHRFGKLNVKSFSGKISGNFCFWVVASYIYFLLKQKGVIDICGPCFENTCQHDLPKKFKKSCL